MSKWKYDLNAINPFQDPVDPVKRWNVGVTHNDFNNLLKFRHEKEIARLSLVKTVLEEQTRLIYKGWKRPDTEDCFVFAGFTDVDYHRFDIEVPPPPDKIFQIYIFPDGTIDTWNWRLVDDQGTPKEMTGELIWQSTQG